MKFLTFGDNMKNDSLDLRKTSDNKSSHIYKEDPHRDLLCIYGVLLI